MGQTMKKGSRFEDRKALVAFLTLEYLLDQIGPESLIPYLLDVTPQRDTQD